jgi:2,4-dienoyl-CoA reductase-like NADH-dependent reductase (Old Yellow Enzyme family)
MAPLTRTGAEADATPSELAALYYAQRASAGPIISEATAVSKAANGAYPNTPGIFSDRQQRRWAEIEPTQPAVVHSLWDGTLVLNTPREEATNICELENLVEWGVIGAAAVGRAFVDLVDRLTQGAELNEPDPATFYSSGPVGYTDYPTLADADADTLEVA